MHKNKSLEQLHEILNDSSLADFEKRQYDELNHSLKDSLFYYKVAVITHMAWIESMDEENLRKNRSLKDIIANSIAEYSKVYRGQEGNAYCLVEGDFEKLTKALHNAVERIEPVFNKLTRLYSSYSTAAAAPIPETSFEGYSRDEYSVRSQKTTEQFEKHMQELQDPQVKDVMQGEEEFQNQTSRTFEMIQNLRRNHKEIESEPAERRLELDELQSVAMDASRIYLRSPTSSPQKGVLAGRLEANKQDTTRLLNQTTSDQFIGLQQQLDSLSTKQDIGEVRDELLTIKDQIDRLERLLEITSNRPNNLDFNSNLQSGVKRPQLQEFMGSEFQGTKQFNLEENQDRGSEERELPRVSSNSDVQMRMRMLLSTRQEARSKRNRERRSERAARIFPEETAEQPRSTPVPNRRRHPQTEETTVGRKGSRRSEQRRLQTCIHYPRKDPISCRTSRTTRENRLPVAVPH